VQIDEKWIDNEWDLISPRKSVHRRSKLTDRRWAIFSLVVAMNLKLNEKLIEEVVRLGGFKSKQEAVNTTIKEYVCRRKRLGILKLCGQIDFDPNWNYNWMRRKRS
jgi:hypothetical protein